MITMSHSNGARFRARQRLYIASSLGSAPECDRLAGLLERAGHVITSRWHRGHDGSKDPLDPAARRALCCQNFDDIRSSEILVFLPTPDSRGSLVEVGFALGRQSAGSYPVVIAVGDRCSTTLMADIANWVPDEKALLWALS